MLFGSSLEIVLSSQLAVEKTEELCWALLSSWQESLAPHPKGSPLPISNLTKVII